MERGICHIAAIYAAFIVLSLTLRTAVGYITTLYCNSCRSYGVIGHVTTCRRR